METENTEIGTTYGYARVSTAEQNENRQLDALKAAGVDDGNIFVDRRSGKDFMRPAWRKLVRRMGRGDLLIVTSIDRMGRNYDDIISEWRTLVKGKGVFIRVLDMPLIDTTTTRGLLSVFISDLVLQILSFVAETEREHIRRRQREGIASAKLRGVRFGRPAKPLPQDFERLAKRFLLGKITLSEASRQCHMPQSTFWKKARDFPPVSSATPRIFPLDPAAKM